MSDCRILVVSCPSRKPIQDMWWTCQKRNWPDCPFPVHMLSEEDDIGWNGNLVRYLKKETTELILLLLDDHFIDSCIPSSELTENVKAVCGLMHVRPEIAMVKVQAGNAAAPEWPYPIWNRLAVYDREPHPFKRTNLVPTVFRREWLRRLSHTVRWQISLNARLSDEGRRGALAFETVGTRITMSGEFPELILGINRASADPECSKPLLHSIGNDGLREGRLQADVANALNEAGISLDPIRAFI